MLETNQVDINKIDEHSNYFGSLYVNSLAATTEVRVPYHIIKGNSKGPVVCLLSTQHGWEPMGAEILRRALLRVDEKKLNGTIISIPLAHPFTVEFGGTIESSGQRVSPADNLDLNQQWPGANKNAWLTQQIAYVIWNNLIKKCEYMIDYHDGTGATDELPVAFAHAFADKEPYFSASGIEGTETSDNYNHINHEYITKMNNEIKKLSVAFGSEIIWWREYSLNPKMLTAQCALNGIKPLVVEAGGGCIIDDTMNPSVECTLNILKHLKMIEGDPVLPKIQKMVTNYYVYRSLSGGHFLKNDNFKIGTDVSKGDELGKVLHPLTSKILETCKSPLNGKIVSSRIKMPINPGGYIAHIADYDSIIWEK